MLIELAVRDLGVIAEARIPFGPGLTALTGETGAGKTMIVEALNLLQGGRADPGRVRPGADDAEIEGLFAVGDTEWVIRRIVPAHGRSRCYINGQLTTAGQLAELSAQLMEIHGQHSQQALMTRSQQRASLDQFGGVDASELESALQRRKELTEELDAIGGDEKDRRRQADLLRYQISEISDVDPGVDEDSALSEESDRLSGAVENKELGLSALGLISDEGAAVDRIASAIAALDGRPAFAALSGRLVDLHAEMADVAGELRDTSEQMEPDEERLDWIGTRRHALVELQRKYGDDVSEVLEFLDRSVRELAEIESSAQRRAELSDMLAEQSEAITAEAKTVGAARRSTRKSLQSKVEKELEHLALPGAKFEVGVEDPARMPDGSEVTFFLSANTGVQAAELAKAASGGELSRVMLAIRLVLSAGPPTMVFDEVDAGVGGEAASAVGHALRDLGSHRQVLVVTHLPQVAASAHHQILVTKKSTKGTTITSVAPLADGPERAVEIARMLSGSPDSATALEHAGELLEQATTADDSRVGTS